MASKLREQIHKINNGGPHDYHPLPANKRERVQHVQQPNNNNHELANPSGGLSARQPRNLTVRLRRVLLRTASIQNSCIFREKDTFLDGAGDYGNSAIEFSCLYPIENGVGVGFDYVAF